MENKPIRLRLCREADQALKDLMVKYPELKPNQILNQLLLEAAKIGKENQDDEYTKQPR
jgi:ribosomal 50S subunit-associated protein YjgA (DUF615 family)